MEMTGYVQSRESRGAWCLAVIMAEQGLGYNSLDEKGWGSQGSMKV